MNNYDNRCKYVIGAVLCIYIGAFSFINVLTPGRIFSESENRNLEQRPKFSFNELFHGKFTSNFEKYISDQFVFRDFWIGIKADEEKAIGKNKSNGVYLGKDGYLLQTFNKPKDKVFNEDMDAVNVFSKSNPDLKKYFMLVPTSVRILSDKLPAYAPVDDEAECINKVKSSIDKSIKFVDVYNTLCSKKNEYIYYKTDHHWTTKGAYYAYNKLAGDMGFKAHSEDYFHIENVTDDFLGSLYSKGGFNHLSPDSIQMYMPKVSEGLKVEYVDEKKTSDSLYNMEDLKKKDKYAVFFDGNHPLIKISTNSVSKDKLLIVKDSYANSLIPFLTGNFKEIYVVDLRYYDDNLNKLIKDNAIKNMLILYNVNTFFEDSSIVNISE